MTTSLSLLIAALSFGFCLSLVVAIAALSDQTPRVFAWLLAALSLGGLVTLRSQVELLSPLLKQLEEWQTLIAGGIAFVGAWLTVREIRRQMAQAEGVERDRRDREHFAARALLPLGLSDISHYSMRSAAEVAKALNSPDDTPDFSLPELPSQSVSVVRECIALTDPEHARQMAELLGQLQVQNARLRALPAEYSGSRRPANYWLIELLLDAADTYSRASALYSFARRADEGETRRVGADDLRSALNNFGYWEGTYPELDDRLGRMARR